MTKVRVTNVFRDINTHEIYKVGAELEFDETRAKHLLALGLVEAVEKPKPAKAEKPAEPEKAEDPAPAAEEVKAEVINEEESHKAEDEQKAEEENPQAVVSERRRARKSTKE